VNRQPDVRPGGSVDIRGQSDGTWTVAVNGGKPKTVPTLDLALAAAGDVTFAPGESPGSWRVLLVEP
jgi:hypothetical protein